MFPAGTQLRSEDGTRLERSGWRDEEISLRHRAWGANCPAVDLDFLVVEYNVGKPCLLVEYKHYTAKKPNLKHPTYRALSELASNSNIPFILAIYWPECWAFKVKPVNVEARQHYDDWQFMSERQFVNSLYRIRRIVLSDEISGMLNESMPPLEVA